MVKEILDAALNTLNDILSIKPPPNLGTIPSPIVVLSKTRKRLFSPHNHLWTTSLPPHTPIRYDISVPLGGGYAYKVDINTLYETED
jgi:hypothetical protein